MPLFDVLREEQISDLLIGGLPPLARFDETAGEVRRRLRGAGVAEWELPCVLDAQGALQGTLTPGRLLALDGSTAIGRAVVLPFVVELPGSREDLATRAPVHGAAAAVVVDAHHKPVAVVGAQVPMDTLRREARRGPAPADRHRAGAGRAAGPAAAQGAPPPAPAAGRPGAVRWRPSSSNC